MKYNNNNNNNNNNKNKIKKIYIYIFVCSCNNCEKPSNVVKFYNWMTQRLLNLFTFCKIQQSRDVCLKVVYRA